jgi:hypothetical protein
MMLMMIALTSVVPHRNSISSLISGKCKQRADCFLTFSVVDGTGNEVASNVFYLANIVQVPFRPPSLPPFAMRGHSLM